MGEIPYGYCQCGCGRKTWIATKNDPKRGYVLGEPVSYWRTHGRIKPVRWLERDCGFETPCWVWQLSTVYGYGQVTVDGRKRRAHKLVYEQLVGPVPDGYHLHHRCENHACVNPAHLQPLTPADHAKLNANAKKTHCKHGHEYTDANTGLNQGRRYCRECARTLNRRRYREKTAKSLKWAETCLRIGLERHPPKEEAA